jgi:hypothetical protein
MPPTASVRKPCRSRQSTLQAAKGIGRNHPVSLVPAAAPASTPKARAYPQRGRPADGGRGPPAGEGRTARVNVRIEPVQRQASRAS